MIRARKKRRMWTAFINRFSCCPPLTNWCCLSSTFYSFLLDKQPWDSNIRKRVKLVVYKRRTNHWRPADERMVFPSKSISFLWLNNKLLVKVCLSGTSCKMNQEHEKIGQYLVKPRSDKEKTIKASVSRMEFSCLIFLVPQETVIFHSFKSWGRARD